MPPARRFRPPTLRALAWLACAGITLACAAEPRTYRGAGLRVASLPPDDVAGAYRAALGGTFNLDDPALWLLADPALLPRHEGLAGGDTMPPAVTAALRRQRLVRGSCQVPVERARTPLICAAARPGYVVRFSAPFALGAADDSLQVHLVVQQYAVPRGPAAERLRFERAYRVARSGRAWRAISEARLPQP